MAALLVILSVAFPAAAATLAVCLAWPGGTRLRGGSPRARELLLAASLGTGLALGVTSCAYFLWLALLGPPGAGFVVSEVVAWALASGALCLAASSKSRPASTRPSSTGNTAEVTPARRPWTRTEAALALALSLALALAAAGFVMIALKRPHGGWDAWAVWNLRARFLFRGGERLADAFASGAGRPHADYPLLVPASVARAWTWAGGETVPGPVFVAAAFTFAAYLLVTSAVASTVGTVQGLAAGLVLVGTAHFTSSGAMQFAEAPMGFFVLAATVAVGLGKSGNGEARGAFAVAGLAAGLAAWTKNEGLAFVGATVIALVVPALGREGRRGALKDLGFFALGAAPALAVVAHFKLRFSPGSEFLARGPWALFAGLADLRRYVTVGGAMLRRLFVFGNGAVLVLVAYAALAGRASPERRRRAATPLLAVALTLCLYVAAYLVSPHDLGWHLATSLDRLLLHLWPAAVFLAFVTLAPPEERAVEVEPDPAAGSLGEGRRAPAR